MRSKTDSLRAISDAVQGLAQLIEYYDIDISRAADGFIDYETQSGDRQVFVSTKRQSLNGFDCYLLANHSRLNSDLERAKQWLREGLNRTNIETDHKLAKSLEQTMKAMDNGSEEVIKRENNIQTIEGSDEPKRTQLTRRAQMLCRGHRLMSSALFTQLKCYYLTNQNPFLRLMSIKVEDVHQRPHLILIHRFLDDREIDFMINAVESRLEPQTIVDDNMDIKRDKNRLAFGGPIAESLDSSGIARRVNRRISIVTG